MMMAEVIFITKPCMVAVAMRYNSPVNRLPRVNIKITLRTAQSFISKLDEVHRQIFTTIMQLKLGKIVVAVIVKCPVGVFISEKAQQVFNNC
jgi:hypothetical protein